MNNYLRTVLLTACMILLMYVLTPPHADYASNVQYSVPVLIYHRIGYTSTSTPLTVTPEHFAHDLATLKENGYETITMKTFEDYVQGENLHLPAKPILITVDDGYRDNYEHAFPLLKKYNSVATFFVITGFIDKYNDRLTSQEIKEMYAAGMSFGSHTVTHHPLAELAVDSAANELLYSKLFLEELLGTQITAITYPRGSYNSETIQIANEASYTMGFTVNPGTYQRKNPPFIIPRIPIFSYTGDVLTALKKLPDYIVETEKTSQ